MSRLKRRRPVPNWWSQVTAVAVLAACLVTVLTTVTSHPEQHRDRLSAAVVNNDDPVTVKGQYTPLGRLLAAKVLEAQDTFDWSLMTTKTADAKLRAGEVVAVVTIPRDFSAKATSMATETPTSAQRAIVHVQTSAASGVSDSAVTEVVTRSAVEAFNNELRENYLDNVYIGLSKMRKEFHKIASGAGELADGVSELDDGTSKAAAGGDEFVVGLKKLASGAVTLSDGIDQLANGTASLHAGTTLLATNSSQLTSATGALASGTWALSAGLKTEEVGIGQLDSGASQLALGLAQLSQQTDSMPEQTQQLAAGASSAAVGASQLAEGANGVAQGTSGVSAGASQLASGLADYSTQTAALAAANPGNTDLQDAAAAAAQLAQEAAQLAQSARQTAAGADEVSQGATGLSGGAGQLADGAAQLASGTPALSAGIAQLSSGAAALSLGLGQLADGAGDISNGAAQLAAGSSRLATGMAQFSAGVVSLDAGAGMLASGTKGAAIGTAAFADGVTQAEDGGAALAGGLHKLADGTSQLSSGTSTFADKLAAGADDMPDYSKDDRTALKKVVSSPADVTWNAPAQTVGQVFFALLAVWFVTFGVFAFRSPLPHRIVESTRPTWRLALDSAIPAIAAGVLTAVFSSIVLWFGLGLEPSRALGLCLFLVFAAASFALVNQALVAALSGWGVMLSLTLAMTLASSAFFSATPAAFTSLFSASPLGAAWVAALRLAATGVADLTMALVVLGWGLAGGAVVFALVSSRRMTNAVAMRRARQRMALSRS